MPNMSACKDRMISFFGAGCLSLASGVFAGGNGTAASNYTTGAALLSSLQPSQRGIHSSGSALNDTIAPSGRYPVKGNGTLAGKKGKAVKINSTALHDGPGSHGKGYRNSSCHQPMNAKKRQGNLTTALQQKPAATQVADRRSRESRSQHWQDVSKTSRVIPKKSAKALQTDIRQVSLASRAKKTGTSLSSGSQKGQQKVRYRSTQTGYMVETRRQRKRREMIESQSQPQPIAQHKLAGRSAPARNRRQANSDESVSIIRKEGLNADNEVCDGSEVTLACRVKGNSVDWSSVSYIGTPAALLTFSRLGYSIGDTLESQTGKAVATFTRNEIINNEHILESTLRVEASFSGNSEVICSKDNIFGEPDSVSFTVIPSTSPQNISAIQVNIPGSEGCVVAAKWKYCPDADNSTAITGAEIFVDDQSVGEVTLEETRPTDGTTYTAGIQVENCIDGLATLNISTSRDEYTQQINLVLPPEGPSVAAAAGTAPGSTSPGSTPACPGSQTSSGESSHLSEWVILSAVALLYYSL